MFGHGATCILIGLIWMTYSSCFGVALMTMTEMVSFFVSVSTSSDSSIAAGEIDSFCVMAPLQSIDLVGMLVTSFLRVLHLFLAVFPCLGVFLSCIQRHDSNIWILACVLE